MNAELKEALKRLLPAKIYDLFIHFYGSLYYVFRLFPVKQDKIVFCNFLGNGYGDNPKYIAEEIIRRGMTCDLVWLLREDVMDRTGMPVSIRKAKIGSIRAIYETVTARVWVDNARKPWYVQKRNGQYYVQTWHGGPALKRVENDAVEGLSPQYVKSAQMDSRKIDVCLSNCRHYTDLIQRSFWYGGEILECGFPRNDIINSASHGLERSIRDKFGLSEGARIVLYAPTFRNSRSAEAYKLDIDRCLASLSQRFPGNWTLMLRLHPNIQSQRVLLSHHEHVIDATQYEDLQELLCAVDAVITDYSSVMFDFAQRRKPVFLFAPDIESYKLERNFYFSLDDLPFPVAQDNRSLMSNIVEFNQNAYVSAVDAFFASVGLTETGEAAKIVVDRIEKELTG